MNAYLDGAGFVRALTTIKGVCIGQAAYTGADAPPYVHALAIANAQSIAVTLNMNYGPSQQIITLGGLTVTSGLAVNGVTLTMSNAAVGHNFRIIVKQDPIGGKLITLSPKFKLPGGLLSLRSESQEAGTSTIIEGFVLSVSVWPVTNIISGVAGIPDNY